MIRSLVISRASVTGKDATSCAPLKIPKPKTIGRGLKGLNMNSPGYNPVVNGYPKIQSTPKGVE